MTREAAELLTEMQADGRIACLTLNRPQRRNAFNATLLASFTETVMRLDRDPRVRAIVLKGAGPVFCAGMDLAEFAAGAGEEIIFGGGILDFIRTPRDTPLIGAVHGAAMAGGFEIALACDMLIAAEGTLLGLPEVTVGLMAGAGGVAHLPRRIPAAVAREMALTGAPITAERAFAVGLVNRVVPEADLVPDAMALAETVAANAPLAVAASKRVIDAALRGDPRLDRINDAELRRVMHSEDAREGALAFRARRAANWSGD